MDVDDERSRIRTDYRHLDNSCRRLTDGWVTAPMFRTAKFIYQSFALGFAVYLIEVQAVDAMLATAAAIALIAGPEAVETWLVRQGVIADAPTEGPGDAHDDDD